ncbi:MAG: hypothetical protein AAGI48_15090 [Verrucomicrobiota bacterium]
MDHEENPDWLAQYTDRISPRSSRPKRLPVHSEAKPTLSNESREQKVRGWLLVAGVWICALVLLYFGYFLISLHLELNRFSEDSELREQKWQRQLDELSSPSLLK